MPVPDPPADQPSGAARATPGPARMGVDLSGDDKLRAYTIVEEARSQFLTWLKWSFGLGILFLGLVGLKGYDDWTDMLKTNEQKLQTIIQDQVDKNLRDNYTARTNEVLDSAAKARAEIAISSRTVADLQSRSKDLDAELTRFRERLAALGGQAEGTATEFRSKLDRLAADFEGPAGQSNQRIREQTFLKKSRAYAARLGLTLPEPRMVFREDPSFHGAIAVYDPKANVYVIGPSKLDSPALPEYAALMGRFFEKNRHVLDNIGQAGFPDARLWQDFRRSIVNYLLVTDKLESPESSPAELSLYRSLKAVEKTAGIDATRKLAVALLEAFDRRWSTANLHEKIIAVNEKVKALPGGALAEALKQT